MSFIFTQIQVIKVLHVYLSEKRITMFDVENDHPDINLYCAALIYSLKKKRKDSNAGMNKRVTRISQEE